MALNATLWTWWASSSQNNCWSQKGPWKPDGLSTATNLLRLIPYLWSSWNSFMVIKNKEDFRLIPVLFAWSIKENLLQVFSITQAFPGPLSRSNDPPDCFRHWLLPQERCLLLLWAAASLECSTWFENMILKRAGSSATTGQHPPRSSKSKLFFSTCKEQLQRIKRTAAEQTEINFWSPEHQDMMTCLTLISACPTYQGREVLCLLRLY